MAHAQKPDFVFRRNGRVHLNRLGRQFSRLLAAEVCASAVVMLDTPCSEVVRRVLATHSIRQFPLHFPSRRSPCATAFQLDSKTEVVDMYQFIEQLVLSGGSYMTEVPERNQKPVKAVAWLYCSSQGKKKRTFSSGICLSVLKVIWDTFFTLL